MFWSVKVYVSANARRCGPISATVPHDAMSQALSEEACECGYDAATSEMLRIASASVAAKYVAACAR